MDTAKYDALPPSQAKVQGQFYLQGAFLRLGNDQQWRVIPCFFLLLLRLRLLSFFAKNNEFGRDICKAFSRYK